MSDFVLQQYNLKFNKIVDTILSSLNENQRQAVINIDGPSMVIAGAGSGKTRVLTYRIAYMISQGVNPFNILSLTFTNKAAKEMKERIIALLGNSQGSHVWMGTFHSIFSKILRIEAAHLGYTNNFTIYDTDDSKNLIKNIIKEKNLDIKIYKPTLVQNVISGAKSALLFPEDYCNNSLIEQENKAKQLGELGQIYLAYNYRLKQADAMDFDDLLVNMYVLLRDFPEILLKYQQRFHYILIDEYQDTNRVQYMIIKKLAAAYENICVVGDDAQSIYSFRGANIENILTFKNDYPSFEIYKLEQNYRSSKNIIKAANSVIACNKRQIPKMIWTSNDSGDKIKILKTSSDIDEAIAVVKSIADMKKQYGYTNNDFTIMYRTNNQSRPFEEALRRMAIPYRIYGGQSFYNRKEIKDVMAYFRLAVNFHDEEAMKRIINYPQRGIGPTSMEHIIACASENNVGLWDVAENPMAYNLKVSPKVFNALDLFVNKIKNFHAQLKILNAFELGKHIADSSGITQDLRENTEEKERYENLGELFNAMKDFVERPANTRIDFTTGEDLQEEFPSLDLFLNEAALFTDADKDDEDNNDKVKLMTIHASKGLEFTCVYVVGVEENIFPSFMVSSPSELEEERRLFYVAITRAKKHLTISFAETRRLYGNFNFCNPSPFLEEISKDVISFEDNTTSATLLEKNTYYTSTPQFMPKKDFPTTERRKSAQQTIFKQPIAKRNSQNMIIEPRKTQPNISLEADILTAKTSEIGMKVYHEKFGIGTIVEIENLGDNNDKVLIEFETVGKKKLLYHFAKLKKISE